MADFHVDVSIGDDANPGTATSPLRSITQATQLAAASPDPTGTIFVAAGTYEPPAEGFPLLVRPGYALQGAGRERTLIRFTGEVRTTSGVMTTYWGGVAIQVGSALRDLTIRANPAGATYDCSGTEAIVAKEDGAVIEHVDVLGPQLPEEYPPYGVPYGEEQPTFGISVSIEGADVTYRNSRVRHGGPVGVTRGGASLLHELWLEAQHSPLFLSSDARVQHCVILFRSLGFAGSSAVPGISVRGGRPTIGPANIISMRSNPTIDCYGGTVVAIVHNLLVSWYAFDGITIRDGASARVANNLLAAGSIRVMSDAAPDSVFEDNVFGLTWWGSQPLSVAAPTDFGGGPAGSRGGNHFGPLRKNRLEYPEGFPHRIPFVTDIPGGGDVHAADNYWSGGRPGDQTLPAPGTRLIAIRPRVDPRTPEDVIAQVRTILSRLEG